MSYTKEKIKRSLYHKKGDDFEDIAFQILKLNSLGNLQKIDANVIGSSDGDGGIDYYDINTNTWYSVYGRDNTKIDEGDRKLKNKIKSDFKKVKENKPGFKINHWVFVCNTFLGYKHYKGIIGDDKINFNVNTFLNVNNISNLAFDIPGGKELLYKLNILDDIEVVIECRIGLEKELGGELSFQSQKEIENIIDSANFKDRISGNLDIEELNYIENLHKSFLFNYVPLFLDGGLYSEKLEKIQKKYRDNINSEELKIIKGHDDLETFNEFIHERYEKNIDSYIHIDREKITQTYLLNSEKSRKGCFYHQLNNGYYDICNIDSNRLQLKKLKDE